MKIVLLIIFLVYISVAVVSGVKTMRRFAGVRISETQRLGVYRQSIISSWIAAVCMAVVALFAGLSPMVLGIRMPDLYLFQNNYIFSIIVISGGAVALIIMSFQCVGLAVSEKSRMAAWEQLTRGSDNGALTDFAAELMIPRSARERLIFPIVAFTAGVCEEYITRGVAFALILYVIPDISPFLLPVISAVVFGFAHIYQGVSGIAKTGVIGLILGFIYVATGSLFPGMLLHFVIDLSNEFISPRKLILSEVNFSEVKKSNRSNGRF
jgi:membrane protease YdiL (CAAX protease family)